MPDDLQGEPGTETAPTAVENTSPSAVPTPEAAPVPVDAAPATGTTTHPPEPPTVAERVTVSDYEAELAAAMAPVPEVESAPGEPAPVETPETAELEATAPVEAEAAAEIESEDTRVPDRIRLGGLSEKDRALTSAAVLLAKAEGISVPEAMSRLQPAKAEAAPAKEEPKPAEHRPETAIAADLEKLDAEYDEAAAAMDTVKMADLRKRERALNREIDATRQAAVEQTRRLSSEIATAQARAVAVYPEGKQYVEDVERINRGEIAEFSTPFTARVDELTALLEEQGNPLVQQPDAMLRIFQMVANEQGIAPRDPARPAATVPTASKSPTVTLKPQPVPQRAVVGRPAASAAAPASGSARTTPPGPPAPAFGQIRTAHDYERILEEVGAR